MLRTGQIVTSTKWGRVVTVPITPRLRQLIAIARPVEGEDDVRFIDLLNNRRLVQGKHTIHERWQRWKKQAGLPVGLHLHDLRRDAANRVYAATGDLREVQGMLGHSTITTTLDYLYQTAPKVKESSITASLIQEVA